MAGFYWVKYFICEVELYETANILPFMTDKMFTSSSSLNTLSLLITIFPSSEDYYHTHFTEGKTEALIKKYKVSSHKCNAILVSGGW